MWAELREELGMPKHPRTSDSRDFSPLLGLKGPGSGNRNADRKIVGVEETEQGLLLQPLVTGCFCRKFWGVGDGNKYPALQFSAAFIGGSNSKPKEASRLLWQARGYGG